MKRLVTIPAVIALVAGCAARPRPFANPPESFAPRSTGPGYVQGFIDGYLSAFPDQPYAINLRAYYAGSSYRATSYRHGWNAGHRTGRKDERQRD